MDHTMVNNKSKITEMIETKHIFIYDNLQIHKIKTSIKTH